MMDNISHMLCLLGTLQNLRIQCECVIPMLLHSSCTKACMKYKTQHCTEHHMIFFVEQNNVFVSYSTSTGTRKPTGCLRVSLKEVLDQEDWGGSQGKDLLWAPASYSHPATTSLHSICFVNSFRSFFFKVPHGHIDAPIGTWKGH